MGKGDGVKLNLGCGNKILDGFVNIDYPDNYSGKKPDIEADLRALPIADETADEAYAIHVLEHFHVWEAPDVLREWKRVLKPGGRLVLELPCLEKVLGWFTHKPLLPQMTWWALYGDPSYKNENMVHKWVYTVPMMIDTLTQAGFENVTEEVPQFHVPQRDMRIVATKC